MQKQRLVLTALFMAALFSLASAQTPSPDPSIDKEKKKEVDEQVMRMLDQAVGDAQALRLPQNRAVIYGLSGDLYWKFDEKRARQLFRDSAGEIVAHNVEVEKERGTDPQDPLGMSGLFMGGNNLRAQLLNLVLYRDAELAIELLTQTRPSHVAQAMQKASRPASGPSAGSANIEAMFAQQEVALEQRFVLQAAEQDPDRAIKLIKDSMSKGSVSMHVLPLLQKIYKKDEKKAMDLASDVVKKLVEADLSNSMADMQAANSMLQFAARPPNANEKDKQFSFTEAQAKEIANKIASVFTQPGTSSLSVTGMMNQALPLLEKYVPEKVALIRQRQAENLKSLPPEFRSMQTIQQVFDPRNTPEDMLGQINKLSGFEKDSAYSALTSRISQIDDDVRAKKLINQIPDQKARDQALERFEMAKLDRTMRTGKTEDLRQSIAAIPKKPVRVQRLVALALQTHAKGGEKEIAEAKDIMKEARSHVGDPPEDGDDLASLMELVRGYSALDPVLAFRLFEPALTYFNDNIQASAVLSRFSPSTNFKKGELVLEMSSTGRSSLLLFKYIPQMQVLGKVDLDQMNRMTDRLERSDARSVAKLYILQGFLRDPSKLPTLSPSMPPGIMMMP